MAFVPSTNILDIRKALSISVITEGLVRLSALDMNNYNKVLEFKKALKSEQVKIDSSEPSPKSSLDDRDQDSTVVHKLQCQYRRFNQEQVEQIIEEYKKGVNMAKLARRFGCHKSTIKRRLREAGIKEQ